MYLDYFGFREKPFTITPNPRFIFLSKQHKEVFAHLLYGIRNHCGFIEVTGEVGAGKTTVLRTLFEQLEGDDYRLAFIFNPSLSAGDLLLAILGELHIEVTKGAGNGPMLAALNDYLLRENAAGRTVVLVIDESQNLAPAVLEQIRLLSNLETGSDKLIQIVLAGQPELGEILERSELRQLSQRITVRYHLKAMDFGDTQAYVRHRLDLVGNRDRELFDGGAMRLIYRYSGGLPRLINVVCDRALVVAFSDDLRRIGRRQVAQAIDELRRQGLRRTRRRWWGGLALGTALGMVLLAYLAWGNLAGLLRTLSPEAPVTAGQNPRPPSGPGPVAPDPLPPVQTPPGRVPPGENAGGAQ